MFNECFGGGVPKATVEEFQQSFKEQDAIVKKEMFAQVKGSPVGCVKNIAQGPTMNLRRTRYGDTVRRPDDCVMF